MSTEKTLSYTDKALAKIADLIVQRMEELKGEQWQKPWFSSTYQGLPQNIAGRPYHGMNELILDFVTAVKEHSLPVFMTFNQATKEGLRINKGAKSVPVLYYEQIYKNEAGNRVSEHTIKSLSDEELSKIKSSVVLKKFDVFNIDDTNFREVKPELYEQFKQQYVVPKLEDTQGMYVWLDALSNYITVIGYPDRPEEWQAFWPANVQVIGKDILRFHAGIWPAMLIALDLPLPKVLLVHGFINVGGAKMSKSLGNGVGPADIIPHYGVEAFRYYFLRHVPTQDDGDFTWEKFEAAYNGELGNDLGNLVQRVAKMVQSYQAGVIGDAPQAEHDMGPYRHSMESFAFNQAMDEIWQIIRSLNQYIERVQPWQVAKKRAKDPEAEAHLGEILAYACGTLLQVSDMLRPFMPQTAEKIHEMFASGVVPSQLTPLFPRKYLHTPDPRAPKVETQGK